ncbi:hypothetical protein L195_g040938, partial [Trifolium pratense]
MAEAISGNHYGVCNDSWHVQVLYPSSA